MTPSQATAVAVRPPTSVVLNAVAIKLLHKRAHEYLDMALDSSNAADRDDREISGIQDAISAFIGVPVFSNEPGAHPDWPVATTVTFTPAALEWIATLRSELDEMLGEHELTAEADALDMGEDALIVRITERILKATEQGEAAGGRGLLTTEED